MQYGLLVTDVGTLNKKKKSSCNGKESVFFLDYLSYLSFWGFSFALLGFSWYVSVVSFLPFSCFVHQISSYRTS